MMRTAKTLPFVVTVGLVLAACGSDDTAPAASPITTGALAPAPVPTDSMADSMSEQTMSESTAEETMAEAMAESVPSPAASDDLAVWQTLPITDVGGETFTLAELRGTPIVLEFFATWCPNCRQQLGETNAAAAALGADAHVVALSVETDLSAGDVASYASDNGFDSIRFAVMSPEMLAAVVDAFGQTAANPPSTPKVVVDSAGQPGELSTGAASADELVATVRGGS